jgi:uncharacterized membrane protein
MKFSRRVEVILLLIIALMFALSVWAWPRVPERIPVHWNFAGEVVRYGSKLIGLLVLPMVAVGMYLFMLMIPFVDPGRKNYSSFMRAYNAIRIVLFLQFATLHTVTVAWAFGHRINMTTAIMPTLGIMFCVFGNFLSKIRPNWCVGVRTPWTLSSRLSWDKTHRLAGWLFLLMGALFFAVALVPTTAMYVAMFTIDAVCLVWIIAYSYVVYRRDPHRGSPVSTPADTDELGCQLGDNPNG